MDIDLKSPPTKLLVGGQNLLIISIIAAIILGISGFQGALAPRAETDSAEISVESNLEEIAMIEENSFLPISDPFNPEPEIIKKLRVVVTGYSSTEDQTDSDPHITAAGTWVRDGIVANNLLSFGTKIRIPELYGEQIFIVEDRMHYNKGNYHIDIWFPTYWQALNFGAKITYIEIL